MCCLRNQLQEVVDAGHPDTAMVALTIGAARELLAQWPADTLPALPGWPVATRTLPIVVGIDLAHEQDMAA